MDAALSSTMDRGRTDLHGLREVILEPPGKPDASAEKVPRKAKAPRTTRGAKQRPPRPQRPRMPGVIALFDGDTRLAAAYGDVLRIYDADGFADEEAKPIAEVMLKHTVERLVGHEDAVIAALSDGTIWSITSAADGRADVTRAGAVDGTVRGIYPTRVGLIALAEQGGERTLVELGRGRRGRAARLPFARIATVSMLDDQGTLVVVDERHGAHLVRFPATRDADALEVAPLDAEARVTAVAAERGGRQVIARKGGELSNARLDAATGSSLDALCRRLREALKTCGCSCHGKPGDHGPDRPDRPGSGAPCDCDEPGRDPGGRDPGGRGPGGRDPGGYPGGDDEPCARKHRAHLGWSVGVLSATGAYLTAVSVAGDRMAVLDRDLNVLMERYLGGVEVYLGSAASNRIVLFDRRRARLETWGLTDYLVSAGIQPAFTPKLRAPVLPTSVFHGQPTSPASPNPHLRIAVMPVLEPGQVFGDADQSKLHALMQARAYAIAQDYFRENSFETLTTEFSVMGVDIGGTGKPLTLPDSFASYFWDRFRAGGLEARMPAAWPASVVFDGSEELTIRTHPSKGSSRDYDVAFAALWTRRIHTSYPVEVVLSGAETLTLDVTDAGGSAHTLTLDFAALNESHAQGDDETAFLATIGQHVTDAVRAAEAAAGSGEVIADVEFRRVRTSSEDSEFGRLLGQWRIAGGGAGKGSIEIVPPGGGAAAGLVALGLAGGGTTASSGTLTSEADIRAFLSECLDATIRDAGEGPGLNGTQLHNAPDTDEDTAADMVTAVIRLTDEYGGKLANIERVSSSGLGGTGWSTAAAVDGSETSFNSRNALRHSEKLAHDTFTAAMDRVRSLGGWDREAVRAQFAGFDGMMIAFVGACPASVPVADAWQCTAAVDQSRFRMFVRRHYSTDQNDPDPSATPVAMPTDLVIGQRFDRFDAAVMTHEIGHGLDLPDLYYATGFRDDVEYLDAWCNMAGNNADYNHFCAWSKWAVGWIPESPDAAVNRVIDVPMPDPVGVHTTEAWLVPVEYWDDSIRADVEAAVGSSLPIGQMMKIHIGSDGGVIDIAEFRARGDLYSQNLSPVPSVIVTNVLDPATDRRWAVNGLYRRSAHLLNDGTELTAAGDRWDFAAGAEFPLKGCVAEIVDIQSIRGGSIPICRLRIEREAAEFVDLYFQDPVPSWRSPDIWVDWRGDNTDPDEPRVYPEGTPTDQGETVRYPDSGTEPHFLVARPHNSGNVHAEDVRVKWFICDPPGAGDDGRWVERDTATLSQLDDDTWEALPFTWSVGSDTDSHQCLRAEIIDWEIPTGVDPATGDTVALAGDDVVLQNNLAQKNVFDFEAAT